MPTRNLHDHPFGEETIVKLEIFEDYLKEWLPTFIMSHEDKDICIFDFFAGPGKDKCNNPGSPIRILKQIKNQTGNIFNKKRRIDLYLNEFDKKKYKLLVECCNQFIENNNELKRLNGVYLFVHYSQEDFTTFFPKNLPVISAHPSLLFLDQYGMKFLADQYLLELEKLNQTDFLYYLSSSYFIRFGRTPEFQTNLKLDIDKIRQNPYKYVHKSILDQLKERISPESTLKLYPFTIKKGQNIFGIIFGAKHILAVDKFLATAWKKNEVNGEANFDIDDDSSKSQLDLFGEKKLTKIESFQAKLRKYILLKCLRTNKDVYNFALEQGHIPSHAADELRKMKKEGLISYDTKFPLVTYEQVYKNRRILEYRLLGKDHEDHKDRMDG